jgi:hypothetical protein
LETGQKFSAAYRSEMETFEQNLVQELVGNVISQNENYFRQQAISLLQEQHQISDGYNAGKRAQVED